MSISVDERVDACNIADLSINELASYFVDLDGIEELCEDMKELYKKEQCSTLGDEKYLRILEKEAQLVEDIAITSINFIREYRKILEVMKRCSSKLRNETKPQKNN
ncbi:hypothetical protein EDI_316410 [Entamoeba dispar SAW760]|uniref:Uncharacterized protein n=1 Tax=Entamoeba dispar (strain ATCC PRA-260 / SAW760) TaxID=370354 RepID=B0E697_ENTDS|nr:uncharacterized protein EDI_316410 [Entamoeba dispar SAW760]EDR29943.1 hypothetical protein EDI_316410 [Entamoeba dispar SAW760]|eukprot:EDR29943.1 hypothetical protein EDI_316410 [Entamoeba dispar SAW760]